MPPNVSQSKGPMVSPTHRVPNLLLQPPARDLLPIPALEWQTRRGAWGSHLAGPNGFGGRTGTISTAGHGLHRAGSSPSFILRGIQRNQLMLCAPWDGAGLAQHVGRGGGRTAGLEEPKTQSHARRGDFCASTRPQESGTRPNPPPPASWLTVPPV